MRTVAKCFFAGVFTALVAVQTANATPILANGSFEGTTITNYYVAAADSTGAWSLSTASVFSAPHFIGYYPGRPIAAEDGSQFALLSAGTDETPSTGSISQTFATTAGQTYSVSFYQNAHYNTNYVPAGGSVTVQASVVNQSNSLSLYSNEYTYTYIGNPTGLHVTDPTWALHTFDFTASGTSTVLSFTSLTPLQYNFNAAIDNVSVLTVPEPSSLLLAGLAAFGLSIATGRRKVLRLTGAAALGGKSMISTD